MAFDAKKAFGTIHGHPQARYEQDGVLYNARFEPLTPEKPKKVKKDPADLIIPHDKVESAKIFLKNVLQTGALSKSAVYKTAQDNNQVWEDVKSAAALMGVVKFQFKDMETWKLSDEMMGG